MLVLATAASGPIRAGNQIAANPLIHRKQGKRIKDLFMKQSITAFVVPLLLSSAPAFSATDSPATCEEKFQKVSESWAETKTRLSESDEVTVTTDDGQEEIAATDAEPTENWFGKPPEADTVDGYIAEAKRAMEAGDTEACMAQLHNAQAAIEPGKAASTEN